MKAASVLLFLAALVPLGGCGYTVGQLHPENVESVAVDVFGRGRNVFRRNLESRLTEAVVKRITSDTPYRISTKSRADTLITGRIENVSQRVLGGDPTTGLPREKELTLIVSFTWTDLRTGRKLREVRSMPVAGTYSPRDGINQDFFQGSEDVINDAAKRIVEQLERTW